MKSNRAWKGFVVWMLLVSFIGPLHAENWKTTDGKIYQDVTVIKTEPDAVTILHHDGGALIPLVNLPPDLQKRFHYDSAEARIAADARAKADAKSAQALQIEMALAEKLKAARDAKDKAEQKEIADRKRKEEAQSHNRMPSDPGVLEPQNHPDGILGPPR